MDGSGVVMPGDTVSFDALGSQDQLCDSAEFYMYCYKVLLCPKRYNHDWSTCPYAHQKERARRRDPRRFNYSSTPCPDSMQGQKCPREANCQFAHSVYEYWLHPARFRTQICKKGAACDRPLCFFAHCAAQLRFPTDEGVLSADGGAGPDLFDATSGDNVIAAINAASNAGAAAAAAAAAAAHGGYAVTPFSRVSPVGGVLDQRTSLEEAGASSGSNSLQFDTGAAAAAAAGMNGQGAGMAPSTTYDSTTSNLVFDSNTPNVVFETGGNNVYDSGGVNVVYDSSNGHIFDLNGNNIYESGSNALAGSPHSGQLSPSASRLQNMRSLEGASGGASGMASAGRAATLSGGSHLSGAGSSGSLTLQLPRSQMSATSSGSGSAAANGAGGGVAPADSPQALPSMGAPAPQAAQQQQQQQAQLQHQMMLMEGLNQALLQQKQGAIRGLSPQASPHLSPHAVGMGGMPLPMLQQLGPHAIQQLAQLQQQQQQRCSLETLLAANHGNGMANGGVSGTDAGAVSAALQVHADQGLMLQQLVSMMTL